MKSNIIFWLSAILLLIGIFIFKRDCTEEQGDIQVIHTCTISVWNYNRINYFCDNQESWKQLSKLVIRKKYSKNIYSTEIFPSFYWGTKQMACGDNSDYDDFDEPKRVFLFTKQDTSKHIYDGALTDIRFGIVMSGGNKKLNDVEKKNKVISQRSNSVKIKYLLNYYEVDVSVLRKFQQSIHFDSTYYINYKKADYQLINKDNNKCLASIRYEDYGKRFYFDVY